MDIPLSSKPAFCTMVVFNFVEKLIKKIIHKIKIDHILTMQNGSVAKHSLTPVGVLHFKELTCKTLTAAMMSNPKKISVREAIWNRE